MGTSQSAPRNLTVKNPDGVIEITENVIDRLKGQNDGKETLKTTLPTSQGGSEHFITSLQIRKEVEEEIKQNDILWEKRVLQMQKEYENIANNLEQEFIAAENNVEKYFPQETSAKLKPDAAKREQLLNCYIKNKTKPLMCSEEAQSFNNHVMEMFRTTLQGH